MSFTHLRYEITRNLFASEHRRLDKALTTISEKNQSLTGVNVDSFLYGGDLFTPSNSMVKSLPGQRPMLHESLIEEMMEHLEDKKRIRRDEDSIGQLIYKLLTYCNSKQEVRDALPDCLADCMPSIPTLERSNEPAAIFKTEDPRAYRQFQKLLPKLEAYSAARMSY